MSHQKVFPQVWGSILQTTCNSPWTNEDDENNYYPISFQAFPSTTAALREEIERVVAMHLKHISPEGYVPKEASAYIVWRLPEDTATRTPAELNLDQISDEELAIIFHVFEIRDHIQNLRIEFTLENSPAIPNTGTDIVSMNPSQKIQARAETAGQQFQF